MTQTVAERLDGELAATRTEYDALQAQLDSLQAPYDRAWKRVAAALRKDKEPPADASSECDRYGEQIVTILGTQKNLLRRIALLSSPEELERRLQDTQVTASGAPRIPRASAGPKLSARDRGVPDVYLGDTGNFRPGMDARYKSDLILSALGLPAPDALETYDPADAVTRIEERGWTAFLDRKREKIEGGKSA